MNGWQRISRDGADFYLWREWGQELIVECTLADIFWDPEWRERFLDSELSRWRGARVSA